MGRVELADDVVHQAVAKGEQRQMAGQDDGCKRLLQGVSEAVQRAGLRGG